MINRNSLWGLVLALAFILPLAYSSPIAERLSVLVGRGGHHYDTQDIAKVIAKMQ